MCPLGLATELHPPHASLFHSLLPACISLLQLCVITEWAQELAQQQLGGWSGVGEMRRPLWNLRAVSQDVSQHPGSLEKYNPCLLLQGTVEKSLCAQDHQLAK